MSTANIVSRWAPKIKEWFLPDFKMKRRAWPILLGAAYVLLIGFLGGLQTKHVIMASLCLLDSYNPRTRSFIKYFFPFILTGLVYDSMRYYYWWGITGHIHVSEPYLLEKKLFGIHSGGALLTPNEYFALHHWKIADFFTGLAYLTFVMEYLTAGFLLFLTNNLRLLRIFGWCFFTVNVMGFATYYIYPAAPPWYVALYGLGPARLNVHASAAAATRFDQLMGTHFFSSMYGMSVDVYGAFPSLHVAYPLLVVWAAFQVKKFRPPAIVFHALMCFSAVYLSHHYILDILLGTSYALVALTFVQWVFAERKIQPSLRERLVSGQNLPDNYAYLDRTSQQEAPPPSN